MWVLLTSSHIFYSIYLILGSFVHDFIVDTSWFDGIDEVEKNDSIADARVLETLDARRFSSALELFVDPCDDLFVNRCRATGVCHLRKNRKRVGPHKLPNQCCQFEWKADRERVRKWANEWDHQFITDLICYSPSVSVAFPSLISWPAMPTSENFCCFPSSTA